LLALNCYAKGEEGGRTKNRENEQIAGSHKVLLVPRLRNPWCGSASGDAFADGMAPVLSAMSTVKK